MSQPEPPFNEAEFAILYTAAVVIWCTVKVLFLSSTDMPPVAIPTASQVPAVAAL